MPGVARYWWLWLVASVVWLLIALVILQFDEASVRTVGVLIGLMFLFSGLQNLAIAALVRELRWIMVIFGLLLVAAGVVSLIQPKETFAGVADILGFLFGLVGFYWTALAFLTRRQNEFWWLGLIAGILMIVLAFWTGGQFFIDKAYVLLVFAGVWALLHALTDLVRAFQVRALRD